ncbi:MAG: hypothetical protein WDM71_00315 [Ferruginibacter sp.]
MAGMYQSKHFPAGYLSSFTCNRNVLLVDEDGGKLVHTPNYNMNENIQSRNIKAVIDSARFFAGFHSHKIYGS